RFAWKVEPITFTATVKEELAFGLRSDFEERRLRIVSDDKLRSDLRGIKKEVSLSGNIRFLGESKEGHCDRFWSKALCQHAARYKVQVGAAVGGERRSSCPSPRRPGGFWRETDVQTTKTAPVWRALRCLAPGSVPGRSCPFQ